MSYKDFYIPTAAETAKHREWPLAPRKTLDQALNEACASRPDEQQQRIADRHPGKTAHHNTQTVGYISK